MTKTSRTKAERRGRAAEHIAALYLIAKGYKIIGRRVKTFVGEIDLIVARGRTTVFVEVKLRRNIDAGLNAIDKKKGARLVRAARLWIADQTMEEATYRFDILILSAYHWPKHLPNAFGAELW